MENQEIDATKATVTPDEEMMLSVLSSVVGYGFNKESMVEDIKAGKLKPSEIVANPTILEKYRISNNA